MVKLYKTSDISLKHNSVKEKHSETILVGCVKKYKPPIFVRTILIDEKAKFSRNSYGKQIILKPIGIAPVMSEIGLFETFVHEQFHAFKAPMVYCSDVFIDFIRDKYKNQYKKFEFTKYSPDDDIEILYNFASHIVVCYNTRLYMKNVGLDTPVLKHDPYYKFEKWIIKNWKTITSDLKQFDLIFKF